MIVVADTSPINYLLLIGHIDVLPYFYGRVLVPPSVWQELQDINAPEVVQAWVKTVPDWLELSSLIYVPEPSLSFLDQGEQEAIALAEKCHADRLIVDEMLARKEAIRRNISVIGTLGVLRNAALAGLLTLPQALSKLQATSFYAAPELIQSLLDEDAARLRLSEPK
jgi:predicted nucleic acid-binding protein